MCKQGCLKEILVSTCGSVHSCLATSGETSFFSLIHTISYSSAALATSLDAWAAVHAFPHPATAQAWRVLRLWHHNITPSIAWQARALLASCCCKAFPKALPSQMFHVYQTEPRKRVQEDYVSMFAVLPDCHVFTETTGLDVTPQGRSQQISALKDDPSRIKLHQAWSKTCDVASVALCWACLAGRMCEALASRNVSGKAQTQWLGCGFPDCNVTACLCQHFGPHPQASMWQPQAHIKILHSTTSTGCTALSTLTWHLLLTEIQALHSETTTRTRSWWGLVCQSKFDIPCCSFSASWALERSHGRGTSVCNCCTQVLLRPGSQASIRCADAGCAGTIPIRKPTTSALPTIWET